MKQGNNNEVDLLLRSLAKGRDESAFATGPASAGGNGAFPDHLDADELNSYAEGVVPVAARARYTEHLADCEACRRIVIDLSQAAGAVNRVEVPSQQTGPGFWQKLAAILSPAVLRYAVPAVLLTAVLGVGLLALRQERGNGPIAQNAAPVAHNQQQPGVAASSDQQLKQAQTPEGNLGTAPPASVAKAGASPIVNESVASKTDRLEKAADAPAPDLSSGVFGGMKTAAKDGTLPGKAGEVAQSQPYALEPKAAAPPPATATVQTENDEVTRNAKEVQAKREDEERGRDLFRNQSNVDHGPNRGAASRNAAPQDARRSGGFGVSGPNADDKKAKAKPSEVETQYVSGRRFAREGNAWVDTAYEAPRATTNVKRGSDQFRALVADEPGLGAIADQLKGVVIVVWKNRAYRIQ
jgi:hypothetical protein